MLVLPKRPVYNVDERKESPSEETAPPKGALRILRQIQFISVFFCCALFLLFIA